MDSILALSLATVPWLAGAGPETGEPWLLSDAAPHHYGLVIAAPWEEAMRRLLKAGAGAAPRHPVAVECDGPR